MIAYYFDESFLNGRVVAGLRRFGVVVMTAVEAEGLGWPDDQQLDSRRRTASFL